VPTAVVALWAWRSARTHVLALAAMATFFAGGALLATDAWQRAWRPSLRVAFEALARNERAEAAREGRRLPEDDEAFAIVHGTLRGDAAPTDDGVSLSIAVDGLEGQEGQEGQEGPSRLSSLSSPSGLFSPSGPSRPSSPSGLSSPSRPAVGGILVTVT